MQAQVTAKVYLTPAALEQTENDDQGLRGKGLGVSFLIL